jgi:hypothetical protein
MAAGLSSIKIKQEASASSRMLDTRNMQHATRNRNAPHRTATRPDHRPENFGAEVSWTFFVLKAKGFFYINSSHNRN